MFYRVCGGSKPSLAEGQLVMRSMQKIGLDDSIIREKFAGVTTDGESANTGRNTGLWLM